MLGPQGAHISHPHLHMLLYTRTHSALSLSPIFSLQAWSGHLCVPGIRSSDRRESELVGTPDAQDSWGESCATLRYYRRVQSREECALQPNGGGWGGGHLRGLPERGNKPSLKDKILDDDPPVSNGSGL